MSRTKNALTGMMALFVACSFLTCTSDTVNSTYETRSVAIETIKVVDDNQIYFDCLADMTDECTVTYIPEESSCEAHGACVDACVSEGFSDYCFSDCDTMYLGIISSENNIFCGCEVCRQECNEWCYCSSDVDSL